MNYLQNRLYPQLSGCGCACNPCRGVGAFDAPKDPLTLGVAGVAGVLGFMGVLPVIKGGVLGAVIGAALGYGGMVVYSNLTKPKV